MSNLPDYELLKTSGEPAPLIPRGNATRVWIIWTLLIVGAAIAAYVVVNGPPAPSPASTMAEPVPVSPQPIQPLGGDAESIVLPPLEESDALVRNLVQKLSSHHRVVAWLATDGLIRNFTVTVANIADGGTPAGHLRMLRPTSSFGVVERGGGLYIDSRSYERYDALAAAVALIDANGSARLYATLKPRIEEAYRELGVPDTPFDRTLERAMVLLLGTPVLDAPVRVEPRGIGYGFAVPELEALPAAQKQLLRAGSRNVRIIQSSLNRIARALGIPAERLPASRS